MYSCKLTPFALLSVVRPSICSGHINKMQIYFWCDQMYSYEPGFGCGLDNWGIVVRFQAGAKIVFSKQPTLAQGGCVTGAKATKVCRRPLTSTRWLAQEWGELWHYSLTRLRGLYKQSFAFTFILCNPNGTSFCDNTCLQKFVLIK